MTKSVFKHMVRNSNKNALAVVVEPWGREYDVPPGSVLQIDVYGSAPHSIESEQKKDVTVIWLSGGGRATVSVDGNVFPPDLN
jgi:hypothetical protein